MKEIIGVLCGGGIGSVLRFLMGQSIQNFFGRNFPWGILFVNVLGCFLMGILAIIFVEKFALNPVWKITLMVGFLGGFTTFSGFTIDVINMFEQGFNLEAIFYVSSSVILCLLATFGGMWIVKIMNN